MFDKMFHEWQSWMFNIISFLQSSPINIQIKLLQLYIIFEFIYKDTIYIKLFDECSFLYIYDFTIII